MLSKLIRAEKTKLITYSNGHLPLAKRVFIAEELKTPDKVNKVFLACCKFVYIHLQIEDMLLSDILNKVENALYKNDDYDFRAIYDQNKNYLEGIDNRPFSAVALACLALCANLYTDAASLLNIDKYEGEDDNSYDWEEWSPDFFASIAFSGGSPFLKEGSITERIQFWNFYLDTVIAVNDSPKTTMVGKIQSEDKVGGEILRTKMFDNSFISSRMELVIDLIFRDLKNLQHGVDWAKVEIEGQNIGGLGMKGTYYDRGNQKKRFELTYYLYDGDESTVNLMEQIKKEIYNQTPKEGTWFSYLLTLYPDQKYKITYNFDDPRIYSDKEINFEPFVEEFKKCPRAKDYTPEWWQEIVKNNGLKFL